MSEKAFSQAVCDYARLHGWMVQRHWSERFSPAGWPDLTFARPGGYPDTLQKHSVPVYTASTDNPEPKEGVAEWMSPAPRLIVAELKSLRGKTTPEQDAWLAALRAAGVSCYIWTPADWEQIEEVLGDC